MSIKGRPYAWFRAALERGDLLGVRVAAAELARIDLADAAAIVVLMATAADPAFERAALKWVARLTTERPYLALGDLADVVSALVTLPHTVSARERLAELCSRLGMGELVGVASRAPPDRNAKRSRHCADDPPEPEQVGPCFGLSQRGLNCRSGARYPDLDADVSPRYLGAIGCCAVAARRPTPGERAFLGIALAAPLHA